MITHLEEHSTNSASRPGRCLRASASGMNILWGPGSKWAGAAGTPDAQAKVIACPPLLAQGFAQELRTLCLDWPWFPGLDLTKCMGKLRHNERRKDCSGSQKAWPDGTGLCL